MGLGRGETWGEINNSNDLPKKSFGNLLLQKLPEIYTCTYMTRVTVELPYNQITVPGLIRSPPSSDPTVFLNPKDILDLTGSL